MLSLAGTSSLAGEVIILAGPSLRPDGTIGSCVDGQSNSASTRVLVPYVTCMKA
jgi:hypothetical protein